MTKDKALELALEALQDYVDEHGPWSDDSGAQYVLKVGKEALAQPEQDWIERERSVGYREGHQNALKQMAQPEQEPVIDGNTSDGYHTFNELYEFRKAYNIALFNEWAANGKCFVHKSWKHNDGELCFGGGWFIVVAVLPQGQISNHYEAKDWDLFQIQETEKALFEFDGHTGADVIERLKSYTTPPQRTWVGLTDEERKDLCRCWSSPMDAIYATEAKLKELNA